METCAGCGAQVAQHPYVAVCRDASGAWVALPVCLDCWREPAHRTTQLKAHFFPVRLAAQAVAAAGSSNLG